MDFDEMLQSVIEEYKKSPIDILGTGDAEGEYRYLKSLKSSYVRTVADIHKILGSKPKKILEIGAFLGPVSISLKKIGYDVCAVDIPEFYNSSKLKDLYRKNNIPFVGVNLRKYALPYGDESFDAIIICETLEHLNFNPLPLLAEINRILKKGGYLYIGMPNQACFSNRLKLLSGKSIHNPVDDFFKQLDREDNMIVGLHWREYTLAETIQMIESMGFKTIEKYFYHPRGFAKTLFSLMTWLAYRIPSFRPFQVVIGRKTHREVRDFYLTEANT